MVTGEESEEKFKLQTAVGKLMASVFCYNEGTFLMEFRVKCADVKKSHNNFVEGFGQTVLSIKFQS
jgi:hypothetical protein